MPKRKKKQECVSMHRNLVAKHARIYNKSSFFIDKKKEQKKNGVRQVMADFYNSIINLYLSLQR